MIGHYLECSLSAGYGDCASPGISDLRYVLSTINYHRSPIKPILILALTLVDKSRTTNP